MSRVIQRLTQYDQNFFYFCNGTKELKLSFFKIMTHIGGATISIGVLILLYFISQPHTLLRETILIAMVSLTISHIFVTVIKKIVKRMRPYLSLPDACVYGYPFKDHSFPSGHSTAIFSVTIPFMLQYPILSLILLPIAVLVALSRVVLGVHYPSDVIAGGLLAITTVISVSLFI